MTEKELYRLVYYSRNRVAGGSGAVADAVATILATSQRNNAAVGVTGALMFNAGCFGQVLEGRREVLESTFERIQQDERHGDVSLLIVEPIAARVFADWSMGFVGARPGDAAAFAGIAASSGFDLTRASGLDVMQALKALALEDEIAGS